ncbi:MAG: type pilus assembly PilZ [Hyphomicrobiales bacterium]|nr:type pilus assembly PilZ [Hyphomicrobiales bacterium]
MAFIDTKFEQPDFDRRGGRPDAAVAPLEKDRREAERRCEVRVRTLMAGRIIYNHGQSTLDCQIRNFSEGGAKLSVPVATTLPNQFKLDVPSRGRCYTAEVRWRDRDSVGVHFREPAAQPHFNSGPQGADLIRSLEEENATLRRRILDLSRKLAEFGVSGQSF